MSGNNFRLELLEQIRRLAFSSGADAAALVLRGEESGSGTDALKNLDLASVSSIHTMANGSVELKFIDRIKLIEMLLAAEPEQKHTASDGFIEALDRAARRLAGNAAPDNGRTDADVETDADWDTYADGETGADGETDADRETGADWETEE